MASQSPRVLVALAVVATACSPAQRSPVPDGAPVPPASSAPLASTFEGVVREVVDLALPHDELLDHLHGRALANGETGIVHYGSVNQPVPEEWHRAFADRFPGLTVSHVALRAIELPERVLAEAAAERVGFDVVDSTAPGLAQLFEAGLLAGGMDALADERIPVTRVHDWGIESYFFPQVVVWNTERFAMRSLPDEWDDLLSPDFAGCYLADASVSWFSALILERGEAGARRWVDEFLASGGELIVGVSGAARFAGVASGELPCLVGASAANAEQLRVVDGAPVDWHAPSPAPVATYSVAVYPGTRNPYSAALFSAWVTGEDGADVVVRSGRIASHPGVEHPLERLRPWSKGEPPVPVTVVSIDRALELEESAARLIADLVAEAGGR